MAVSKRLRFEVLRRDGHTCRYCGRSAPEVRLTVDHVVPVALGGSDAPENLVTACSECNSGKSATPPDAALVDDVQQDALRWAAAVRQVAQDMVTDVERRERVRLQFRAGWERWDIGGRHLPLPPNWRDSVDQFVSAGLPVVVLAECVDIAMGRNKVEPDDKFRYMCGIAWKRVSEIQDAALQRVGRPTASDTVRQGNGDEVISLLFGALPWCGPPETWADLLAEFEDSHDDYENEDGTPRSFDHWSDFEKVFAQSVRRVEDMRTQLAWWTRDALNLLSPSAAARLRSEASWQHGELGEPFAAYMTGEHLDAYAVAVLAIKEHPEARHS
jgi:hypothetical protein